MNSLAKKVTLLQVVIVTLSMFAFIFYISTYLSGYIKNETENKIQSNIANLEQTVRIYLNFRT